MALAYTYDVVEVRQRPLIRTAHRINAKLRVVSF